MMSQLLLLVGLPGSRKSTFAKSKVEQTEALGKRALICSADDFFMKDGVYKFDPALLGKAHAECYRKAKEALLNDVELIIIDNTNIRPVDRKKYYSLAVEVAGDYRPCTPMLAVLPRISIQESFARNTHKVPEETIARMNETLGTLEEGFYIVTDIGDGSFTEQWIGLLRLEPFNG